jgi:hypothetical protein
MLSAGSQDQLLALRAAPETLNEDVIHPASLAVFAGQYVGLREVADAVWLVSFME